MPGGDSRRDEWEVEMRPERERHQRSPSPTIVVALLALFVALGGGAYAVVQIGRGDIKARHIAREAVRAAEIKRGAVRSSEVRDGTLREEDLVAGALPGSSFATFANRNDPTATPDALPIPGQDFEVDFTTPEPGRLVAAFAAVGDDSGLGTSCGGPVPHAGLYVDGSPVPDTDVRLAAGGTRVEFTVFGATADPLAAGTHTLAVGVDCPGASTPGVLGSGANNYLGAVLLGV